MKRLLYRIAFLLRSNFKKKESDPLKEMENHINTLEKQLNNVGVSLSTFKSQESVIRSNIEGVIVKIEKVSQELKACVKEQEKEQLKSLHDQYKLEALDLGKKLEAVGNRRIGTQLAYQKLRVSFQKISGQLEDAKARYYTAETNLTLYGDASGITGTNGMSRIDSLFRRVKKMETDADSFVELSPLDVRIDGEINK